MLKLIKKSRYVESNNQHIFQSTYIQQAFFRTPQLPTPSPNKILDYSNVSNSAGAVASYFLMSLGPEPQANFPLGIVILILCFIRGVLVNSYLAFPNIKCLNCIDFVLRTLEHLEIIIMLIIPSFLSFVAYKQAKGKYFFIHIQTLVLMFLYLL